MKCRLFVMASLAVVSLAWAQDKVTVTTEAPKKAPQAVVVASEDKAIRMNDLIKRLEYCSSIDAHYAPQKPDADSNGCIIP